MHPAERGLPDRESVRRARARDEGLPELAILGSTLIEQRAAGLAALEVTVQGLGVGRPELSVDAGGDEILDALRRTLGGDGEVETAPVADDRQAGEPDAELEALLERVQRLRDRM